LLSEAALPEGFCGLTAAGNLDQREILLNLARLGGPHHLIRVRGGILIGEGRSPLKFRF
jgi:hypothetical protein